MTFNLLSRNLHQHQGQKAVANTKTSAVSNDPHKDYMQLNTNPYPPSYSYTPAPPGYAPGWMDRYDAATGQVWREYMDQKTKEEALAAMVAVGKGQDDLEIAHHILFQLTHRPYKKGGVSVFIIGSDNAPAKNPRGSNLIVVRGDYEGKKTTFAFETAEMTTPDILDVALACLKNNMDDLSITYTKVRVLDKIGAKKSNSGPEIAGSASPSAAAGKV